MNHELSILKLIGQPEKGFTIVHIAWYKSTWFYNGWFELFFAPLHDVTVYGSNMHVS